MGVLPGRGLVPIIGPVYGFDVDDPSAGFFGGSCLVFSSPTIRLEISGTELKFIVAGRSKQLRDLSRAQGPASTVVATQTAERPNTKAIGNQTFICRCGSLAFPERKR